MSKIAIVLRKKETSSSELMAFKSVISLSISELKQRISSGKPIFEGILFENNHLDIERVLKDILRVSSSQGLEIDVYELEPDEDFETAPLDQCSINEEILLNILDEWKKREQTL